MFKGQPLYTTCNKQKNVALTFDDGPSFQTLQILSVQKSFNVEAKFFVLANSLDSSVLRQIAADGNLIASHGWSHTNVITLDNSMIIKE